MSTMLAEKYDFEIQQGATFSLLFTWFDSNEAPMNLVAYTAQMMLRHDSKGGAVAHTFTSSGVSITLSALGEIVVSATAVETSELAEGRYGYDLELTSPSGVVSRIVEGFCEVTREATRA